MTGLTVRIAPTLTRTLLRRCALYLGPLSVMIAAAEFLGRLPWPVPAGPLVLGWSAAQALTGAGSAVARRAGSGAGVRVVGLGFLAAGGLWCAVVLLAPASVAGAAPGRAIAVGLCGLASLATVTAALVTRSEVAVVRWSVPIWLLAGATVTDGWSGRVPVDVLLPASITLAALRAYRPLIGRRAPARPGLTAADLRCAGSHLVIGAAQAGCVALLWRTGGAGTPPPAMLPLLAAVPLLEALIGWHAVQVDAGLDEFDSGTAYARHLRSVTVVTVAGLVPPLAIGVALIAAAYRLPYGLSGLSGAREVVLALAGGTLLSGVLAATLLLAVRGRTAAAAVLAAAPLVLTGTLPVLAGHWLPTAAATPDLLPIAVTLLAVTHLVGLSAVAHTALDHRRTS